VNDRAALNLTAAVAEAMDIPAAAILSRSQSPRARHARRTVALILHRRGETAGAIGHFLAGRNHSTVAGMVGLAEAHYIDRPGFRVVVDALGKGE
jgi:chromosomal replication initiation ATPase DnaA